MYWIMPLNSLPKVEESPLPFPVKIILPLFTSQITVAGIPSDELQFVKETFYKGKTKGSGSGLGLSISQRIIQAHKGEFAIMSEAGKGTTVEIKLPLLKSTAEKTGRSIEMKRFRILILNTAVFFLLAGCNFFPEPASLIQAPKQIQASGSDEDHRYEKIKKHLPGNTSLSVPNEPVGMDSVIGADFNNDGVNEAVAFFKSKSTANQAGAIILQKKQNEWEPLTSIAGNGYEISWGSATDITEDGIPELLIGWKIGVTAGNVLDIYQWKDNQFIKLQQINFHELELISAQNSYRLAVWKRTFEDVYQVDVLKWNKNSFVSDKTLYPSYFTDVAGYYRQRTDAVPDAAYYWYYLAESLQKAEQYEAAMQAVNEGMKKNLTASWYEDFIKIKDEIEKQMAKRKNEDVQYYVPYANITMNIPQTLASHILIEEQEGTETEYLVHVLITDNGEKRLLFSIAIQSKEFLPEDQPVRSLFESEHLMYSVTQIAENPIKDTGKPLNEIYNRALPHLNDIISSVRLGPYNEKHTSIEDELLIKKCV